MTVLLLISAFGFNILLAYTDKYTSGLLKNNHEVLFFSFCKTLTCAVLAAAILPFGGTYIDATGVLIAVLAGVFHSASVVLIMLSLKRTDGVYVNLFMAAGIVFPSLFGWILWKQELSALKICALVLLIVFLFLMLRVKGGGNFHFPTAIAMFASYGLLMVAQGAFPKYCENGSGAMFSVIMYACSAMFLGIFAMIRSKCKLRFTKKLGVLCLVCAIANLAINLLLTRLSSMTDAVVTFPVVHGGKLVAVTLLSGMVWKERLGAPRIFFALLSIVCIVLLST